MPNDGPGLRHTAVATKEVLHGKPCVEDGFPGIAFKVAQFTQWANPATRGQAGGIDSILEDEEFEIMLGGIHDVLREGAVAGANVGTDLYIEVATNAVVLAATALTAGALEAGYVKFGKVTDIDTQPAVDILKVNANFLELVAG